MLLKKGSFAAMAKDIINNDSAVIIYGVGVIGLTVVPEIVKKYGISDRIACCIDNDNARWNTTISMFGRELIIEPINSLKNRKDNITVLMTISRYQNAYEQLLRMDLPDNISCYIIPAMCIENFHNDEKKGIIKNSSDPIIPKIIHYMWLGKKEIPSNLNRCIESWKRYCPDYEIIRWDESNYDVHKNLFVSQAYDNKKYGFVPDYARIELLYEYGGIYLDTDVELKKNIDELLYQEAFCSVEKWQVLNFGGCSGAVKGHRSLKAYIENWEKRTLVRDDGSISNLSSGLVDTTIAISKGYVINGKNQTVDGMNIYTYDYFHPYDYMSGKLEMTKDTFSIHHFNGGWLDSNAKANNKRTVEQYTTLMSSAMIIK